MSLPRKSEEMSGNRFGFYTFAGPVFQYFGCCGPGGAALRCTRWLQLVKLGSPQFDNIGISESEVDSQF